MTEETQDTAPAETAAADPIADATAALDAAKAELAAMKDMAKSETARLKELRAAVADFTKRGKNITAALSALPADAEVDRQNGQAALNTNAQDLMAAEAALAAAQSSIEAMRNDQPRLAANIATATTALKLAKAAKPKPTKAPKVEVQKQNGMPYPKPNTISHTLWTIFDQVSRERGSPAAFSEVESIAAAAGVVPASIRAGYAHWKRYYGLSGRIASAAEIAEAAAKAEAAAQAQAAAKAEAAAQAQAAAKAEAAAQAQATPATAQ